MKNYNYLCISILITTDMKKLLFVTILLTMIPMFMRSQSYSSLWKQVSDAQADDLPQSEQKVLDKIVDKAKQERNYGQLLKASVQKANSLCMVSPDSLRPAVEMLQQQAEEAKDDVPLQAIYYAVLGYVYSRESWLDQDRHEEIAKEYYDKALAHPEALAAVKATDYEPFVVKGIDSRYFDDDLLSLIGKMDDRFQLMRDYYLKSGNRRASMFTSLWLLNQEKPDEVEPLNKSKYIQRLDSLISEYEDLPECGDIAISRFHYMDDHTDATPEQKWQYINKALERWGSWQRMNDLRNAQKHLINPQFVAEAEHYVDIPQHEQTLKLTNLRNITEITMRLYSVKAEGNINLNPDYDNDYKKIKPLLTALPELTQTHNYVGKRPYELFEDSITMPGLAPGVYMMEIETQPASSTSRKLLFVSDVRVLTQRLPDTQLRIVVVNATTGQPIKGAKVDIKHGWGRDKKEKTLTMNDQGEYVYSLTESGYEIRPYTNDDKACPDSNPWGDFSYDSGRHADTSTDIFTDRAIYRPGQTVHVAIVHYRTENGRDHKALANKQLRIELRDANNETVKEEFVTTDDFGSAATQFTLPTQGLTGNFSICCNYESHYFRVEEYKRPTFEVDIPRVAQNYEDGDTVVARGNVRSYAGVPVQGASVKYTVKRTRAYWWMSYSHYWGYGYIGTGSDDEEMAKGETVTDEKGQFTVDIPMILPKTKYTMFYNFVLTAEVTDQAGESHQGTMSLPLGNRKTALSVTLPEKVLNEGDTKMAFHQQNAAGIDLDAKVRYRFDNGRWQEVATNQLIDIPQMKSGKHTLKAICETDTLEQEFVVFSLDDRRPATDTRSWFYTSSQQFPNDDKPVTVQAGSSDRDVHVVYTIYSGDSILESGTAELSNELINRKFQYKEEYGNGLLLTFAWMKLGVPYTYSTTIRRPLPDMHLSMKWNTFRNKLTPGQEEEWTLTVTKPDGQPADAQLMATLYDKSLDQLMQHDWSLVPMVRVPLPSASWHTRSWGALELQGQKYVQTQWVPTLTFNHFDTGIFPTYHYYSVYRRRSLSRGLMLKGGDEVLMEEAIVASPPTMVMMAPANGSVASEDAEMYDSAEERSTEPNGQPGGAQEEPQAEMQMRENLNETAFFMPQLVADSTGLVKMKFTLPESLTTWRFLGVAHTRDMMYGQMSDEAVARKDVMIQPNMPRFLRHDDQGTISARIMNMSDAPLSGTAMLQLLDPETEKVVYEQKQHVSVADSSTIGVAFPVSPSTPQLSQYTLLIARVSISTPKQSDGEQHYLPILPSSEHVTVTVPFTQIAPGTHTIDLQKLVPVDDPQAKLTVEYTNNPAWLMIQALPSVGHPYDDCAVCQAASLYANVIGRHILEQNPSAKHVFEMWSREQGTETSLMSSLQKDTELKDLLLNETPWVMDADREQEQKQRLAEFFDANLIGKRIGDAITVLDQLQNGDGSWSWWPHMHGSVYVTNTIAEMLVRLNQMTGEQEETKKMLGKAFGFMGDYIVDLVKEMKKREKVGIKQYFPSRLALEWLYICALDKRELPGKVAEANNYLKNLLKKDIKNQTIMEKALSAIILNNKTYVKSLKEWSVYKEDMGRYYDTPRAGYSWRDYKIPTQVAAIEALKMLTPQDSVTVVEMQRWLLQQKRTQAWDTPLNSADAIYAFLNGNSQVLAPQAKTVLSIDSKPIDISEATAGIGYVKTAQTYSGQKTFTAEKTSTGTSWGAVYAQFTQPTHDIDDQASGISVKREILKDHSPLTGQPLQLNVGDRITIRITIEAERDYDFVQLQDKRAACMEPVKQLSGYNWYEGYYCTPKDYTTSYFFDCMAKGRHIIETEYYIDREGTYETGTCTVQCAYSPEFRATTKSMTLRCAALNDK